MDTLKRIPSLRLSKRKKKKTPPPLDYDGNQEEKPDEPNPNANYLSLGRPKGAKAYFMFSFSEVVVNTNNNYQPTHLKAVIERRRQTLVSEQVLWEASLRDPATGSGVWHPPFSVNLAITVPKLKAKATGTLLRHKDAYISILNFDIKGKKKLLAKARLNLSDYFEEAAEKDISFRLKLHPESSKISSASIDLKLRKSHQDPTKLNLDPSIPILADTPSHEIRSHCSTPSGLSQDLEKEPLISQDEDAAIASSNQDEKNSPDVEKVVEVFIPPPEKNDAKIEQPVPITEPVVILPKTPPPLPPRDRIPLSVSNDPPCPQDAIVTSTPLPPKITSETIRATLTLPLKIDPPSRKSPLEFDDNDNDEEEENDDFHQSNKDEFLQLQPCIGSPKIVNHNADNAAAEQEDLIEWAKKALQDVEETSQVKLWLKVTNLTSSWRNGVGFCALIYQSRPDLIPLSDLTKRGAENSNDNNEIAFDAADMLRIDTQAIRQDRIQNRTDKNHVKSFLHDLRATIGDDPQKLEEAVILEYKKKWYSRGKYFKKEVGHLVKNEKSTITKQQSDNNVMIKSIVITDEEESKGDESVETAEVQAEKEEEEKTPESNMSRSPSPEKNARAKAAIKQAHDSSSYDESSEKSTPSTTSDTGGPLCESMTILQEMSQLKREEDEICDEIKRLETKIRDVDRDENNEDEKDLFDAMMIRFASLVSQKNSIVHRQMQLNLAQKRRRLEHEKREYHRQYQKLLDLDESMKTEAMRNEEEKLQNLFLQTVDSLNLLVREDHFQEELIEVDEGIDSFIADRNNVTNSGHKRNNIMDFFKQDKTKK